MSLKGKFACVHGHFYQPPRESPWLGEVEAEDSAYPFHDWNARILEECYGPNAAAAFRNPSGRIEYLADNYRLMSFNFGPTLLSWLEKTRPELYDRIREADAQSASERGHGNALAQPYVHAILPLVCARDKRTLLRWGIADFRRRFRRPPEGLWLPETGVDEETLEAAIAEGIRFTILAPWQAARVKDPGAGSVWRAVDADTLDVDRPYRWPSRLQPGKEIALFFYFQGLAAAVVKDRVADGKVLAERFLGRFRPDDSVQLVHLAADGEYFGHHNPRGDEGLSLAFRLLEAEGVTLVNYAQFLDLYPPPQEVEIRPNTAWSCPHGLGRWTSDCGCRVSDPSWRQNWRRPLREAIDRLSERVDALYESKMADAWSARDSYLCGTLEPRRGERPLLEMQRHRLLMHTSCAWFFDDVSGLEAVLALKFAARALELAASLGRDLSSEFMARLAQAPSNIAEFSNAERVFAKTVEPLRVDARRAAARFALLEALGEAPSPSPFELKTEQTLSRFKTAGEASFYAGLVSVVRPDTGESFHGAAVAHRTGRLDLAAWAVPVCPWPALEDLARTFDEKDGLAFREVLRVKLGEAQFTIDALFPEERRRIVRRLVALLPGSPLRDFLPRWERALGRLREDPEQALSLLESCRDKGITASDLPDLELLRSFFLNRLESPALVTPLLRWLELSSTLGLGPRPWQERFFYWRWRSELGRRPPAHPHELDFARALGERLGFAEMIPAGGRC